MDNWPVMNDNASSSDISSLVSEEEIRGAESVWRIVLGLLQSGTPPDGIATIGRLSLEGLAELRKKLAEPSA